MSHHDLSRSALLWSLFFANALTLSCGEAEQRDGQVAAQPDAEVAPLATKSPSKGDSPYDEEGILLPDPRVQALGTPLPRGFENIEKGQGTTSYQGEITPQKVFAFYQRYLDCSHVIEGKRGWQFNDATPRSPGDTSRKVDVTIIKRGRSWSTVNVVDRMGFERTSRPDGGIQTAEERYEAAHKGVGSVREPIPGTY